MHITKKQKNTLWICTAILIILIMTTIGLLLTSKKKNQSVADFIFKNNNAITILWNNDSGYFLQKTGNSTFVIYEENETVGIPIAEGSFVDADTEGWSALLNDINASDAQITSRGERNHAEYLYVDYPVVEYRYIYYSKIPNCEYAVALCTKSRSDLDRTVGMIDFNVSQAETETQIGIVQ